MAQQWIWEALAMGKEKALKGVDTSNFDWRSVHPDFGSPLHAVLFGKIRDDTGTEAARQAHWMVMLSLASLRTLHNIDDLRLAQKRHQVATEQNVDSRARLPTVSDCLEKVQLARASLRADLEESIRSCPAGQESREALEAQLAELGDVLDQAGFVFLGFVLGAHQLRSQVLPSCRSAISRGKRTLVANLLGLAQTSLSEMFSSIGDVQRRYEDALENALALVDVAACGGCSESRPGHLGPALALSDLLSDVQTNIGALEVRAQRLRGELMQRSSRAGLPPGCAEVCEELLELCTRCHPSGFQR